MLKDMTFGALAHLIVSLFVVALVLALALANEIGGDVALITALAVGGISAPAQLLTTATTATKTDS